MKSVDEEACVANMRRFVKAIRDTKANPDILDAVKGPVVKLLEDKKFFRKELEEKERKQANEKLSSDILRLLYEDRRSRVRKDKNVLDCYKPQFSDSFKKFKKEQFQKKWMKEQTRIQEDNDRLQKFIDKAQTTIPAAVIGKQNNPFAGTKMQTANHLGLLAKAVNQEAHAMDTTHRLLNRRPGSAFMQLRTIAGFYVGANINSSRPRSVSPHQKHKNLQSSTGAAEFSTPAPAASAIDLKTRDPLKNSLSSMSNYIAPFQAEDTFAEGNVMLDVHSAAHAIPAGSSSYREREGLRSRSSARRSAHGTAPTASLQPSFFSYSSSFTDAIRVSSAPASAASTDVITTAADLITMTPLLSDVVAPRIIQEQKISKKDAFAIPDVSSNKVRDSILKLTKDMMPGKYERMARSGDALRYDLSPHRGSEPLSVSFVRDLKPSILVGAFNAAGNSSSDPICSTVAAATPQRFDSQESMSVAPGGGEMKKEGRATRRLTVPRRPLISRAEPRRRRSSSREGSGEGGNSRPRAPQAMIPAKSHPQIQKYVTLSLPSRVRGKVQSAREQEMRPSVGSVANAFDPPAQTGSAGASTYLGSRFSPSPREQLLPFDSMRTLASVGISIGKNDDDDAYSATYDDEEDVEKGGSTSAPRDVDEEADSDPLIPIPASEVTSMAAVSVPKEDNDLLDLAEFIPGMPRMQDIFAPRERILMGTFQCTASIQFSVSDDDNDYAAAAVPPHALSRQQSSLRESISHSNARKKKDALLCMTGKAKYNVEVFDVGLSFPDGRTNLSTTLEIMVEARLKGIPYLVPSADAPPLANQSFNIEVDGAQDNCGNNLDVACNADNTKDAATDLIFSYADKDGVYGGPGVTRLTIPIRQLRDIFNRENISCSMQPEALLQLDALLYPPHQDSTSAKLPIHLSRCLSDHISTATRDGIISVIASATRIHLVGEVTSSLDGGNPKTKRDSESKEKRSVFQEADSEIYMQPSLRSSPALVDTRRSHKEKLWILTKSDIKLDL